MYLITYPFNLEVLRPKHLLTEDNDLETHCPWQAPSMRCRTTSAYRDNTNARSASQRWSRAEGVIELSRVSGNSSVLWERSESYEST